MTNDSPEFRDKKLGAIEDVLLKKYPDFNNAYAYLSLLATKFPEGINNEIRNSLSHLARAMLAENDDQLKTEVTRANNHIERATRDSLKTTLSIMLLRFDRMFELLEKHGKSLTRPMMEELRAIKQAKKDITQKEGSTPADEPPEATTETVSVYMKLLEQGDKLNDDLRNSYGYDVWQLETLEEQLGRRLRFYEHLTARSGLKNSIILTILGAVLGVCLSEAYSSYFKSEQSSPPIAEEKNKTDASAPIHVNKPKTTTAAE